MDKINTQTPDLTDKNIAKIAELFPNVITEKEGEDGMPVKVIDFELLKQELAKDIVDGSEERYRLDWPGKRRSILKANTPISKTLVPDKESSVDFDNTKNIYIEGDNFEVLKILQESYLNKIKMIYIDPPYNTGKDFVYKDDFKKTKEEYEEDLGVEDEEGGRLFKNTDTNGRFHSDWLSMMYERLVIARDLLKDDGVIFISIDDNEVHNLRKICDEIFGEENLLGVFIWQKKTQPSFLSKEISVVTEYVLAYKKENNQLPLKGGFIDMDRTGELINIGNPIGERILKKDSIEIENGIFNGLLKAGEYGNGVLVITLLNNVEVVNGIPKQDLKIRGRITMAQATLDEEISKGAKIFIKSTKTLRPTIKKNRDEIGIKPPISLLSKTLNKDIPTNTDASSEMKGLFDGINIMDYPKPVNLIKYFIDSILYNFKDSIVLDFFSGSATTAHAVMQLNADDGGNRKFVMVQLPEPIDEKSEAYKAGYKTIAEIGRERIRRAGKRIVEENADKLKERETPFDIGFRAYKVADSIMQDVYKSPNDLKQGDLLGLADNIREDKKPEDILTSVILDLGLTLDLPIKEEKIGKNTIFNVDDGSLVACFDKNIDFNVIDEIAKMKPLKVVFRDASFKDDKDRINVETKFKQLSPDTNIKVI